LIAENRHELVTSAIGVIIKCPRLDDYDVI